MENPAQGAQLSCQLMKELKTLPAYKDTLEHFLAHGNHAVRYSSHEWSGTWCDICIEQTLMNAANSVGGLSRGRMRNSFSVHKCWVLTLSHFSDINQRLGEDVSKYAPLYRDLLKTQMKRDAEAVELALKWFEENMPFDNNRGKELLMSFSTGFTSTGDDSVNAERAAEGGMEMQIKLDGQSVTSSMDVRSKVKALSSLRMIPTVNEKKIHLDSGSTDWSYLPSGKWQLRQAYSMSWLPSHYPCNRVTKIRRWTRQTRQTFQRQAWRHKLIHLTWLSNPEAPWWLMVDGFSTRWSGDRKQLPELCALWSLMATAYHQKIMTTSGIPRTPAVISRFDQIWFTGHQEQSSWITLITSMSSSTSSVLRELSFNNLRDVCTHL